jgi:DMSO/TMAO reductase YedYZ molybdopterin-dependent catalytic subunit
MCLTVAVLTLHFAAAQDSASTLSIRGDIQKPVHWSVEALKMQFAGQAQQIKFAAGKDKQLKVGTGVSLLSVVQAAALKTDQSVRHHDLKFLVILEATDSYRVFFSLAELMPQCGHAQAWLIWSVDGKPLSEKESPVRLVVSSDQGADRYIYGISTISLVDGDKLAKQLKADQ